MNRVSSGVLPGRAGSRLPLVLERVFPLYGVAWVCRDFWARPNTRPLTPGDRVRFVQHGTGSRK